MDSKKVIFIIVEGYSDENALGHFFKMLYFPNNVHIHVEHGDITSKKGVLSTNIVTKVADRVKQYAKKYNLNNSDFEKIIHIIDTDGAFVPNNHVIYEECSPDPYYSLTDIKTSKVREIQKRNQDKKSNIIRLISTNTIWNIQYKVYYMSCNLDHVLYNKLNSSTEEKENDSLDFYDKYEDDYTGFIEYICHSEFSVNKKYKDSWIFIKQGLNSLNRFTNINLCFDSKLMETYPESIKNS